MKFREMTKKDAEYLRVHSISNGIFKNNPEVIEYSYSLEHEGILLVSGGFRFINESSSWCWIDMTHHALNHIPTVYRVIKEWMLDFVKEKKIRRLQAYIDPDFPEAVNLIQHLNFKKESIMTNFYPDRDAYMYARIF